MKPKKSPLLPRERQVAAAICEGLTYKGIAAKLGISRNTVNTHITNIHRKWNVSSNVQVAMIFHGLYM